jgi:Putative transposase
LPWFINVLHTFGSDLKWNPHIHSICTAWWISFDHKQRISLHSKYIPYESLNARRKYNVINNIRIFLKQQHPDKCNTYKSLLSKLYKKERYIRCEPKITNLSIVIWYVSRYVYRPPLAQSRITHYDGNNVTIKYEHKQPKETRFTTFTGLEFIEHLARHIPNKYFHTVHYGWIFSSTHKQYFLELLIVILPNTIPRQKPCKLPAWFRERMIKSFGKDPLECPCCKTTLTLLQSFYTPYFPNTS